MGSPHPGAPARSMDPADLRAELDALKLVSPAHRHGEDDAKLPPPSHELGPYRPPGHSDLEHEGDDGYYSDGSSYVLSSSHGEGEEDKNQSLTRQLAETAVGVREMSKQLGRARVKSKIESVLIITKARDNQLITYTRDLALWLMLSKRPRGRGLIVYVDQQLQRSKRFNPEGIRRDYPQVFEPIAHRAERQNSSTGTPSIDADVATSPRDGQLRYWTPDLCTEHPELIDFVVTLGGDGTVLFASWLFQRIVPPVLPFSLGSLGFLTNFEFGQFKKVMESVLDDGIRVNMRMRFTATVYRVVRDDDDDAERQCAIKSGKTGAIYMKEMSRGAWQTIEHDEHESCTQDRCDNSESQGDGCPAMDKEVKCFTTRPHETFEVLNDLVVDRGPSPFVTLLEIFGNEHHMTTVQADGICIATPTGSTAYSLAAGGSLAHPEIPAILITPICPHTLSFRPMLLPDSMDVRIVVPYNSRSTAWASFDGRGRVELKQGDHIKVTASRYPFPSVCRDNQSVDWFRAISTTLKWNQRQRQKSFVVLEDDPDEDDELQDDDNPAAVAQSDSPLQPPAPTQHAGQPTRSPAPASSFASTPPCTAPKDIDPGPSHPDFVRPMQPRLPAPLAPLSTTRADVRPTDREEDDDAFDVQDRTHPATPSETAGPHPSSQAADSNSGTAGGELKRSQSSKPRKSTEALPRLPLSHLTRTHAPKGMRMSSLRSPPSRSRLSARSVPGSGTHTPVHPSTGVSASASPLSLSTNRTRSPSPAAFLGPKMHPPEERKAPALPPSDDGPGAQASPVGGSSSASVEEPKSDSPPRAYSPDRYGSAGPPKPPTAVSLRHMTAAGFRQPGCALTASPAGVRTRRREGSVAAELAASANAARQSAADRRASLVAGNLVDHLMAAPLPSAQGSHQVHPQARPSKTTLVVYGDDDSDSELEEEPGSGHVHYNALPH